MVDEPTARVIVGSVLMRSIMPGQSEVRLLPARWLLPALLLGIHLRLWQGMYFAPKLLGAFVGRRYTAPSMIGNIKAMKKANDKQSTAAKQGADKSNK